MIKFPWEEEDGKTFIEREDNNWILNYLVDKEIPFHYVKKPPQDIEDKVKSLFTYLNGSRNFILIVSNNSAYIKTIYYYMATTWFASTNSGFEIADLGVLDKEDFQTLYRLENTSLLIVPYTDPGGYELRRIRNIIGNILLKRKIKHKPTLLDVFTRSDPGKLTQKDLSNLIGTLSSVYGEQCVSMFMDKESNSKLIKIRK